MSLLVYDDYIVGKRGHAHRARLDGQPAKVSDDLRCLRLAVDVVDVQPRGCLEDGHRLGVQGLARAYDVADAPKVEAGQVLPYHEPDGRGRSTQNAYPVAIENPKCKLGVKLAPCILGEHACAHRPLAQKAPKALSPACVRKRPV